MKKYYSDSLSSFICYLPVCKIDVMRPQLAKLFIRFISCFMKSQGIAYPEEHEDLCYALNMDCDEEEQDNEIIEIAENYKKGHICKVFNRIKNADCNFLNLSDELNKLHCKSEKEKQLIATLLQGLKIMKTDRISNYFRLSVNHYDNDEFALELLFGLVWDCEDAFCDYAIECLNCSVLELSNLCPREYFYLSPTTDKIPEIPIYPSIFVNWLCELINILMDYE